MRERSREIPDDDLIEPALEIAQALHATYRRLAPDFRVDPGPVEWDYIAPQKRGLIVATVLELLGDGRLWSARATLAAQNVMRRAQLWEALMDADEAQPSPAEALRRTARGAAEDWQEALCERETQA